MAGRIEVLPYPVQRIGGGIHDVYTRGSGVDDLNGKAAKQIRYDVSIRVTTKNVYGVLGKSLGFKARNARKNFNSIKNYNNQTKSDYRNNT